MKAVTQALTAHRALATELQMKDDVKRGLFFNLLYDLLADPTLGAELLGAQRQQ